MSTELIQSLCRPGVLEAEQPVELVETHISYILLTGEFAYKIKKPVNLGFVDFSTLEKRLHFCLEELRLNRRLAAELYLGVIRITGTEQDPQLGGSGPSLEFAVKMKKFPRDRELRSVLRTGDISPACFRRFAEALSQFHDDAAVANVDSKFSSYKSLNQRAADNFRDIRPFINQSEILRKLELLRRWSSWSVKFHKNTFKKRKSNKRIRECHGDLHLGNLVLLDDRIVPFDCLEFNENFRWIDVASEIAFLVMDLYAHGCEAHARRFLNWYLELSGDYEMLVLLRHYLVYRAMVLAKVACLRGNHSSKGNRENADMLAYLSLAERFARQRSRKRVIITHGFSGCGKTWVSDRLLERTTLVRVRSDVIRKQLHGLEISAPSLSGVDAGIYSKDATHRVYEKLAELSETVLKAGYPILIDATFLKREYRKMFKKIAEAHGVPFYILHLDAPKSVLTRRITERQLAKTDASEADLSILEKQLVEVESLDSSEQNDAVKFCSDNHWTGESTDFALENLGLVKKHAPG
jgi:aminoglycoside phosphotransferase family enzyme/predicted kinase